MRDNGSSGRFTDAELDIARNTDLPSLLESLGYHITRKGSFHSTTEMDSLRIKNRRTWFRYSENVGGDAITFLEHFQGMTFTDAVRHLLAFNGYARDAPALRPRPTPPALPAETGAPVPFILPPAHADQKRVYAYLRKRGICHQVIVGFIDAGLLYAVLLTTDETNATDAITVTPEKVARLRSIFYEMNEVEYASEIIEEEIPPDPDAPRPTPTPDGEPPEPETKRVLHIYVTVKSLNYKEAADLYRMTEQQREVLDEMMSAEFAMLFAEIAGVDVLGGADLTQIISGLPTNGKGAEVVKAALTKLGAPYVWGAKGDSKFDCSGLAYWSIKQVDASLGDRMYTNAAGQAKYCYDRGLTVGESELQPGDLVFWQNLKCKGCHRWEEVHHVGIYIGGGKVVEASSGKGRVVIRDLWSTTNYPIYMFGRPY